MTYTDAQLASLRAASQRDDGLLPRPAKRAGAVLRSFEVALTKAGAAEAIAVSSDQPHWRLEAEGPIGLRITAAGRAAIGVDPAEPTGSTPEGDTNGGHDSSDEPSAPAPPRTGTKRARLIELLAAPAGTGIDTLVTTLAWQPHTVRAALTRLRQDGFAVVASKDERNRAVYRIDPSNPQDGSPDPARSAGKATR